MKKIILNKITKQLFEGTAPAGPAPAGTAPSGTAPASGPQPPKKRTFEADAKKKFFAEFETRYINAKIILPSSFGSKIPLAKAPGDLKVLMQNVSDTNMPEFKNTNNMMFDPTTTYDKAPDCAKDSFSNLPDELNLSQSKSTNESYIFEGETGVAAAVTQGVDAAKQTMLTGITAGAKIGLGTAAGAYGVGYAGDALFGDTGDNLGKDDSALDAKSERVKNTKQSGNASVTFTGASAIDAITNYLKNIKENLPAVFSKLTSKDDAFNELQKQIEIYVHKCDNDIKLFVEKHDKTWEELEKRDNKERFDDAVQDKLRSEIQKQVLQYAIDQNLGSDKISEISNNLSTIKNKKSLDKFIDTYIGSDPKTIEAVKNAISRSVQLYQFEGIQYSFNNVLNEDDSDASSPATEIEKPVYDFTELYEGIQKEFSDELNKMFPLSMGRDLPGIKEAEEMMKNLEDKADAEIKTKIKQVCKTDGQGNGIGFSNSSGILATAASFIAKHPMKAAGLERLWEEHKTELDMRKRTRLKSMMDLTDITHAQGWTVNICKRVIPEIIARMIVYRGVLNILKEKKIYNYNSLMQEAAEKEWNENKSKLIKDILDIIKTLMIYFSKSLTDSNEPGLLRTREGALQFDKNFMPYVTLLLLAINPTYDAENFNNAIQALKAAYANNDANALIEVIFDAYKDAGQEKVITEQIATAYNDLNAKVQKIESQKLKPFVKKIYDEIKSASLVDNANDIFAMIVDKAENDPSNNFLSLSIKDLTAKLKDNDVLDNTFTINDVVSPEDEIDFKSIFTFSDKDDYYGKIFQIFNALNINENFDFDYSPASIKQIGAAVKKITMILSNQHLGEIITKANSEHKDYTEIRNLIEAMQEAWSDTDSNPSKLINILNNVNPAIANIDTLTKENIKIIDKKAIEELLKSTAIEGDKIFNVHATGIDASLTKVDTLKKLYEINFELIDSPKFVIEQTDPNNDAIIKAKTLLGEALIKKLNDINAALKTEFEQLFPSFQDNIKWIYIGRDAASNNNNNPNNEKTLKMYTEKIILPIQNRIKEVSDVDLKTDICDKAVADIESSIPEVMSVIIKICKDSTYDPYVLAKGQAEKLKKRVGVQNP